MHTGFWQHLSRPILGLAPMDGVTDAAFRHIMAVHGRPALTFTEFTSVEGIRAGAERLLDDLLYSPQERPAVAQLFGADPEAFVIGAAVAGALGFDGIDINMGCPAKNVTQKGAGASLILDPERAIQIQRMAQAGSRAWAEGSTLEDLGVPEQLARQVMQRRLSLGLGDTRTLLPVSVKTRIGYAVPTVGEWIPRLLEAEPVAITVHGRTLKQLYSGAADWEAIGEAAALVHASGTGALALGNGDIHSLQEARDLCRQYGTDGALIGRAAFGNPWLFQEREPDFPLRLRVALEHARYLDTVLPGRGFVRIRKHLLDYVKGPEGAKELRMRLMKVDTLADVEAILLPVLQELQA